MRTHFEKTMSNFLRVGAFIASRIQWREITEKQVEEQ
jgi:hypothetical protein